MGNRTFWCGSSVTCTGAPKTINDTQNKLKYQSIRYMNYIERLAVGFQHRAFKQLKLLRGKRLEAVGAPRLNLVANP